jgi:hypothetical protein
MKRIGIKNTGWATGKALLIMIGFGIVAHAGLPYLPLVGPPALRVMVAKDPHAAVVPLNANGGENSTNSLAAIEITALNTNANAAHTTTATLSDALPLIGVGSANALNENFGVPVLGMTSPEFLNITPGMLATYFRPVVWGTNAGFVGPFPSGFVPPFAQREKSSHAEYEVK